MATTERSPQAQLSTARYLLAQFITQLDEFEAMNRQQRRTPRGRDLAARLAGLREGRAKWEGRVAGLEARVAAESADG